MNWDTRLIQDCKSGWQTNDCLPQVCTCSSPAIAGDYFLETMMSTETLERPMTAIDEIAVKRLASSLSTKDAEWQQTLKDASPETIAASIVQLEGQKKPPTAKLKLLRARLKPAELPEPIAELPEPIAELPEPIAELPEPTAEAEPIAELPEPIAEAEPTPAAVDEIALKRLISSPSIKDAEWKQALKDASPETIEAAIAQLEGQKTPPAAKLKRLRARLQPDEPEAIAEVSEPEPKLEPRPSKRPKTAVQGFRFVCNQVDLAAYLPLLSRIAVSSSHVVFAARFDGGQRR